MSDEEEISIGFLPRLCCCKGLYNKYRRLNPEREITTRERIQTLREKLPEPSTSSYLKNDLLTPLWRTMSFHPKYSECFLEIHNYLMYEGAGPLSASDRHYIAIMAASRHYCAELVGYHEKEFKAAGGDEKWISEGLETASGKMMKLNNVNIILAHRPWRLTKNHIKELTSGNKGDNWSISEVVEAVTLLCHFHALSSFVMGCVTMEEAIRDEVKNENIHSPPQTSKNKAIVPGLVERMKDLNDKKEELELSEIIRRYEAIEKQEKENEVRDSDFYAVLSEKKYSNTIAALKKGILQHIDATKYTTNHDCKYMDFVRRHDLAEYPTFLLREFCWPEHGYCTMSRLLNEELANLLDKKFNLMMNLTYRYIGEFQCVDTHLFREAAWNYIQLLVGVRQDDYNYGLINQLLNKNLKSYIKALTCFPEHCVKENYRNLMSEFKNSEKIHLCLIVSESRFQNELLFALNAVSNCFKN